MTEPTQPQPKFKIGQTVWCVKSHSVESFEVNKIRGSRHFFNNDDGEVFHYMAISSECGEAYESKLYATKSEAKQAAIAALRGMIADVEAL